MSRLLRILPARTPAILLTTALGTALALALTLSRAEIADAQLPPGTFTSTPQFAAGGLANVVFSGGTVD